MAEQQHSVEPVEVLSPQNAATPTRSNEEAWTQDPQYRENNSMDQNGTSDQYGSPADTWVKLVSSMNAETSPSNDQTRTPHTAPTTSEHPSGGAIVPAGSRSSGRNLTPMSSMRRPVSTSQGYRNRSPLARRGQVSPERMVC